jgi:signal transduction histidine kinase
MTGWRRPWWIVAIALAAGLLVQCTRLQEGLSAPARDAQLRWLADPSPPAGVLVLDIDDASLAALKPLFGPWPYGRDVFALAIERLRDLGARAIALDVLLLDERPGDEALARTLTRPGAPVVLAAAGLHRATEDTRRQVAAVIAAGAPGVGDLASRASLPQAAGAKAWGGIAMPSPSVWPGPTTAPRLGLITAPTDPDGVLRCLPTGSEGAGAWWPMLPVAVLKAVGEMRSSAAPEDARGCVHLVPPSAGGWPLAMPFAAVVAHREPPSAGDPLRSAVAGQVVFIGSSALLADSVLTVQGQISGTRLLAHAYAALRDGEAARAMSPSLGAGLLLLAVAPTLIAVWHGGLRTRQVLMLSAVALVLWFTVAAWALWAWRMPALWAASGTTALTGLGLLLLARHQTQAADRRRLEQQLEVARRTGDAKRQFLAQVSHELRTPMNALLGVAELLQQSDLTPAQRRHVQVFRTSGQSLLELINDLLDVSRIDAGRLDIVRDPFSLHALLDHLDALFGERARGKGVAWTVHRSQALPDRVTGDRKRIEQALNNLLGNAIKFTSRGSIRFEAVPDNESQGVRFIVRDTGIGIAKDRQQAIFLPFEQADRSISRQFGGTGLGLSITRSLADAMGGHLDLESAPGLGSTFTLTLPLPIAPTPLAEPSTPPSRRAEPPPELRGLSLLLAEDNEVNVHLFCAMLDGLGLQIDVAPDGLDALDRLRRNSYDMAFIDVQMPGLDGLSVTRELRELEARGGRDRLPVVALTANAMPEDVDDSRAAGCDRHLSKPVSRSQLIEAVRELAAPTP